MRSLIGFKLALRQLRHVFGPYRTAPRSDVMVQSPICFALGIGGIDGSVQANIRYAKGNLFLLGFDFNQIRARLPAHGQAR